jgi:hypothetical protein
VKGYDNHRHRVFPDFESESEMGPKREKHAEEMAKRTTEGFERAQELNGEIEVLKKKAFVAKSEVEIASRALKAAANGFEYAVQ